MVSKGIFRPEADKSIEITQRPTVYLRAYTVVDDDLIDTPEQEIDKAWVKLKSFFLDRVRKEAHLLTREGLDGLSLLESELAL